jgi:hypothetical protein
MKKKIKQSCVQCGGQLQVLKNTFWNSGTSKEVQSRVCVNSACPNYALLAVPIEGMINVPHENINNSLNNKEKSMNITFEDSLKDQYPNSKAQTLREMIKEDPTGAIIALGNLIEYKI